MLNYTCNNLHCSIHPDGKAPKAYDSNIIPFQIASNGLCMYSNSVKRHESYGHIKIEYINVCGSCETPISVSEELCWDCNHDINGCDTCHPTD